MHNLDGAFMTIDPTLAGTVAQLVLAVLDLSDAALERDWSWRGKEADVRWGLFRAYEELQGLAVATTVQRCANGAPPTAAQAALALYQAAYRDLCALLLGIEDGEIDRVPAEGEWPLRQVLAHVILSESRFLAITNYALRRRRAGEPVQPMPDTEYDAAPYAEVAGEPLSQIWKRYDALHQQVLDDLTGIGADELSAPIAWWYDADVRFQLYRFDAHLREHTIQAEKVLEAIRPRPTDAHRTVRLIYAALAAAEGAAFGAPDSAAALRAEAIAAIEALRTLGSG